MARHRGLALSVALLTCIATITSIRWLSAIVAGENDLALPSTSLRHQIKDQHYQADQEIVLPVRTQVASQSQKVITAAVGATSKVADSKADLRLEAKPRQCRLLQNTEYNWGDVVEWGSRHKKNTAEECCRACQSHKKTSEDALDCNVWVWCGDEKGCGTQYKECWLKHLLHPEAATPLQGPTVPWTSGGDSIPGPLNEQDFYDAPGPDRSFHTVVTAQGAATHWQARVAYYWFKKVQRECQKQKVCHMGGFTRILHSGEPDELMGEIPTHVVNPLQDRDHRGYVVLNRPWAIVQWLKQAVIKERYILMSEPDHIWLKPMPNLMIGEKPAAFPFFYIEPAKATNVPLVEKFTGKLTRSQIESISPIGNAPTLLSSADLNKMAEIWMNTSHAIFDDDQAHKAWNWILEMYGFAISCYTSGVCPADLHVNMMAQPPWSNDRPWGPHFYLLHYTYGMDYSTEGKFMPGEKGAWRFDKRTYGYLPPPRNLQPPPDNVDNNLVRHVIHSINEASEVIPGWDSYAKSGKAEQFWDGRTFKDNPRMTASYLT